MKKLTNLTEVAAKKINKNIEEMDLVEVRWASGYKFQIGTITDTTHNVVNENHFRGNIAEYIPATARMKDSTKKGGEYFGITSFTVESIEEVGKTKRYIDVIGTINYDTSAMEEDEKTVDDVEMGVMRIKMKFKMYFPENKSTYSEGFYTDTRLDGRDWSETEEVEEPFFGDPETAEAVSKEIIEEICLDYLEMGCSLEETKASLIDEGYKLFDIVKAYQVAKTKLTSKTPVEEVAEEVVEETTEETTEESK